MGEISDGLIEQQIWRGHPPADRKSGASFPHYTYDPRAINSSMDFESYTKLLNFLTKTLNNEARLDTYLARRYIYNNLLIRGCFPHPRVKRLTVTEHKTILRIIENAGLKLVRLTPRIGGDKMVTKTNSSRRGIPLTSSVDIPKAEVENVFKVKVVDVEEGEISVILQRGIYQEVIAVAYAYPHYRKLGFYAGKKSSVFAREEDRFTMLVDMHSVMDSLATLLNNLVSADKLTESTYNGAVDGFEPFLYEALDFSEFESLIHKTSGLKEGKKKRIKARGTKGSDLQI